MVGGFQAALARKGLGQVQDPAMDPGGVPDVSDAGEYVGLDPRNMSPGYSPQPPITGNPDLDAGIRDGAAMGDSEADGNYRTNAPALSLGPEIGANPNAIGFGEGGMFEGVVSGNTGAAQVLGDPQMMANMWADQNGYNLNDPLLLDDAQTAMLHQMMFGDISMSDPYGSQEDFLEGRMNAATSPGGAMYSPEQVFNATLNATPGSMVYGNIMFDAEGRPVTPEREVDNVVGMLIGGIAPYMPPPVLKSMQGIYLQAGAEYQMQKARGYQGTFTQYLGENGLSPEQFFGE